MFHHAVLGNCSIAVVGNIFLRYKVATTAVLPSNIRIEVADNKTSCYCLTDREVSFQLSKFVVDRNDVLQENMLCIKHS
jgi:hypothetical protein